MGGLLFIGIGLFLIATSGWVARYNYNVRSRLVAHYEERVRKASGQTLQARMELASAQFQLAVATASLEAGSIDRICLIIVGLVAVGIGVFAVFHPNGW